MQSVVARSYPHPMSTATSGDFRETLNRRGRRGEHRDLKPVYQDNCDTIKSNIFNHTFTSVLSVLDHDPFSTKATSFNYS